MTKAKSGKKKSSKGGGGGPSAQQVTAAHLFQQAQIALRFDDFDAAKNALKQAVRLEPRNGALLDAYACLLAELSDPEAKAVLQQAISVAPDSGHEKYMYVAQLEDDPAAALKYSSQGLALLQAKLTAAQADASQQAEVLALSKALCKALCTHAEMMISQACQAREEAAAAAVSNGQPAREPHSLPLDAGLVQQVEGCLTQASQLQPTSPEPGQALASLRYEQGRAEEALNALKASMSHWWDDESSSDDGDDGDGVHDGAADDTAMQAEGPSAMEEDEPQSTFAQQHTRKKHPAAHADAESEDEEEEEDDVPSFEFRFECAKLLLELDESTDTAVGVLSSLVEEFDSNPDVWHLLALALYSGHQYEEALEVAGKGTDLLRKLRVPKKDDSWASFEDLVSAIKEAMGHAAAAAGAAGIKGSC